MLSFIIRQFVKILSVEGVFFLNSAPNMVTEAIRGK